MKTYKELKLKELKLSDLENISDDFVAVLEVIKNIVSKNATETVDYYIV